MANNIAVIGGGASGLTAAIAAAKNGANVAVLESGARVGKKILSTGNGRCNMTNLNASKKNYHGKNPNFTEGVINRFWVDETLDFFSSVGIETRADSEGRVYPYSEQASAVLDALRLGAAAHGVRTICSFEACSVTKENGRFKIKSYDGQTLTADKVIIATGGKASPSLGSKGVGYDILKNLGHTITDLRPSLVQIKTDPKAVRGLKGIHTHARVTLGAHSEVGEILFTEYGLSGIAVFSLTSRLCKEDAVTLDLMPEYEDEKIVSMLMARRDGLGYLTLEDFLIGILSKRVGQTIMKQAGAAPLSRGADTLSDDEINRIAHLIKNWKLKIEGTMSWNNAQVTKGGADTSEFDSATLQSKKVNGLYACGEVLDVDGDCGGYNLQWAWASGYIAGSNAAK